jgi:hypothetical protein
VVYEQRDQQVTHHTNQPCMALADKCPNFLRSTFSGRNQDTTW